MRNPMVSIIIPVKNRPVLIKDTLQSLIAQTYPYWEALVIDDASTDETVDVIASFSTNDERIRLLQGASDKAGAPVCRNIGIKHARGQYFLYLDSDDILAPSCLRDRVEYMEKHPQLDFGVFQGGIFYEKPGDTNRVNNLAHDENDLDRFLRRDITWQTSGPIYRRKAVTDIGPWDELLPGGQDVDYAMRAMVLDLKYACNNVVDYYIRSSQKDRGRISTMKWKKPERLLSFVYRTNKLINLMEEKGKLNESRRLMLAGNFFFVAERWADLGNIREALRAWSNVQRLNVISTWKYIYVVMYLRIRNTPLAAFGAYYMYVRWPRDFFINTRMQGGRYKIGQRPGIYEVPVADNQHPFHRYHRIFREGPISFVLSYLKRRTLSVAKSVSKFTTVL